MTKNAFIIVFFKHLGSIVNSAIYDMNYNININDNAYYYHHYWKKTYKYLRLLLLSSSIIIIIISIMLYN